jgi:hypothetical protein
MGGKVLVPTSPVHPHARRGAPRRRRDGRAHGARRPHRRRQRQAPHQRRRRARPALLAPAKGRTAEGFYHVKGGLECAIARGLAYAPYADLSGARPARPTSRGQAVRRGRAQEVPRQDARLQLLAQLQLEEEPRRRDHRQVPARARGDGVQVPVRHPRGLPHAQPRHVRCWPRLQRARHGGVLGAPAERVRRREGRLHRHAPPARGGHGLLRRTSYWT